MGSPIRTSDPRGRGSWLDQTDTELSLKKIRGKDVELKPVPSEMHRDYGQSRLWASTAKDAAKQKQQELNRQLLALKSSNWQDRQLACEYMGQEVSIQNYRAVARLVDVIACDKDSNVLDAALQALLRINGCSNTFSSIDHASGRIGGGSNCLTPLHPSTAGLGTPLSGASCSPMNSGNLTPTAHGLEFGSRLRRPSSGCRLPTPPSPQSKSTLSSSVLGARPLRPHNAFPPLEVSGLANSRSGVRRQRRPASASAMCVC